MRGPDTWHLIYHSKPGAQNTFISHATSDDLIIWTKQEPVLGNGRPGDCDARGTLVGRPVRPGSWPARGTPWRSPTTYGTGTSCTGDGSHAFTPDPSWSGWREEGVIECKGPFIFRHENRYLMFYSSESKWGDSCLAVAASKDLVHWEDEGPLISTHKQAALGGGFECPRVVRHGGKYYLFVMVAWRLQYAVGDDPFHFGPWTVLGTWHSSVIFSDDQDRWYITHALRPFGQPPCSRLSAACYGENLYSIRPTPPNMTNRLKARPACERGLTSPYPTVVIVTTVM